MNDQVPSEGIRRPGYSAQRIAAANRRKPINWFPIGCGVVILALVLAVVGGCNAYFDSTRDVTVKVNKTGQTCSGSGSSHSCTNLVYTSGGTFQNSDSLMAGKFNSSDVTGALCPGGVYKLKVRGWRIGFFSEWPNILKIEQVVTPPPSNLGCSN